MKHFIVRQALLQDFESRCGEGVLCGGKVDFGGGGWTFGKKWSFGGVDLLKKVGLF